MHSSAHGCLGCSHGLAVVSSAAVNTGVHVFFFFLFRITVLSGYIRKMGLLDHMVILFLVF